MYIQKEYQPLLFYQVRQSVWERWRELKPAFSCEKDVNMKTKKIGDEFWVA